MNAFTSFANENVEWTAEYDEQLIQYYTVDELTVLDISSRMERSPGKIISRLISLGVITERKSVRGYEEYKQSSLYQEAIERQKQINRKKNRKTDKLRAKYDDLKDMYDELDEDYEHLEYEYDEIKSKYNDLKILYRSLSDDYDQLDEEFEHLDDDYEDLEVKYMNLKEESRKKDETIRQLVSVLSTLKH